MERTEWKFNGTGAVDTSERVAVPAGYHGGWDRWIASNLAANVSRDALRTRLVARGFAPAFVDYRLDEIERSPALGVARDLWAKTNKLSRLLDLLGELGAPRWSEVDEREPLPPDEFYLEYVFANRPVVIRGLMAQSCAVRTWTPRLLAERLGSVEVDLTAAREGDPRYEENFSHHVRRCRFSEFIDRIEREQGNDSYLVGKNRLLRRPEAAVLLSDIEPPDGYLQDGPRLSECSLWIGPAGTITPLHHDACNILLVQIYGSKRIKLVAPAYLPRIYNDRTCFTDLDAEAPDFERFPLARGVPIATVDVAPGDALLLPVGWWHQVRSLDTSISLTFTQFRLPRAAHVWRWRDGAP